MEASKWRTESLLSQSNLPSTISAGDVVSLNRFEENVIFTQPIYICPHLMERKAVFDAFVASERYKKLYITGAPGCGKTIFITLLACMYAKNESKNVLIVNYRHEQACPVFAFRGRDDDDDAGGAQQLERCPFSSSLCSDLEVMLDQQQQQQQQSSSTVEYDLVVYDGVRQNIGESSRTVGLLNSRVGRGLCKVVFVTSLAFRLKGGDLLPDSRRIHEEDSFDSWERDDYVNAIERMCSCGELESNFQEDIKTFGQGADIEGMSLIVNHDEQSNEDDTSELTRAMIESYVEFKYYYAGGSARFMFDLSIERLRHTLQELTDAVKDDQWKAFTRSSIPSATDDAVNSLMQRFRDNNGIGKATGVSQVVIMNAYDRCGREVAEAVASAAAATGNPSLRGWAFELEQLGIIKSALQTSSTRTDSSSVTTDDGIVFHPTREADFDGTRLKQNVAENETTVIWCLRWDQGCFDVAIYSQGTLVTVQFTTVSKTLSLNLCYIRKLREELDRERPGRVLKVVHVGINETGELSWKRAKGAGASHCEVFSFALQPHSKQVREGRRIPYWIVTYRQLDRSTRSRYTERSARHRGRGFLVDVRSREGRINQTPCLLSRMLPWRTLI